MSIGVPVKLLHEAEGHTITIETQTGELFRGLLVEAEDNMNVQMSNIAMTGRDGHVSNLEQIYIRGSKIRFIILPDMLRNAPMFKLGMKKGLPGKGLGLGRARTMRARQGLRGKYGMKR